MQAPLQQDDKWASDAWAAGAPTFDVKSIEVERNIYHNATECLIGWLPQVSCNYRSWIKDTAGLNQKCIGSVRYQHFELLVNKHWEKAKREWVSKGQTANLNSNCGAVLLMWIVLMNDAIFKIGCHCLYVSIKPIDLFPCQTSKHAFIKHLCDVNKQSLIRINASISGHAPKEATISACLWCEISLQFNAYT